MERHTARYSERCNGFGRGPSITYRRFPRTSNGNDWIGKPLAIILCSVVSLCSDRRVINHSRCQSAFPKSCLRPQTFLNLNRPKARKLPSKIDRLNCALNIVKVTKVLQHRCCIPKIATKRICNKPTCPTNFVNCDCHPFTLLTETVGSATCPVVGRLGSTSFDAFGTASCRRFFAILSAFQNAVRYAASRPAVMEYDHLTSRILGLVVCPCQNRAAREPTTSDAAKH